MTDLESNRKAASEFFTLVWNEKDESAIDRFIAENAAGNDRSEEHTSELQSH